MVKSEISHAVGCRFGFQTPAGLLLFLMGTLEHLEPTEQPHTSYSEEAEERLAFTFSV